MAIANYADIRFGEMKNDFFAINITNNNISVINFFVHNITNILS